ncbi:MAG: long-chain-fatty-acid--CoA ligase, partial [Thaumarchaeota archaeon]|nr:long-chain-fatty-acid--CoA ligase [Nitrososphaerota archaeon]
MSSERSLTDIQDNPLLIHKLLSQTIHRRSPTQVVYGKTRETWGELFERAMQLASGLKNLGVKKGSKVAVIDYDTHNYLEAYYAIPSIEAVLHTVNIRLPPEQIAYTISHAEDEAVLVRDDFLPLLVKALPGLKRLKQVIVMSESGNFPEGAPLGSIFLDDLLKSSDPQFRPGEFDENTPATIFYTSGTTGAPKGVWFTHRQLVLHTLSVATALSSSESPVRLESRDVILPLVPMFHVHGWGFPYITGLLGQKYILVGKYDPERILKLISEEKATWSHMVPTILNMVLHHPSVDSHREGLKHWKVVIGGSALPSELARKAMSFGIRVMTGYGLSETAPILTLGVPTYEEYDLPPSEMLESALLKAGLPVPLVDLRVVDDGMKDVKRDGKQVGELIVRSPWTTKEYYKDAELTSELWKGGWLHTKDLATVDGRGHIKIVDRAKDAVKSGGEWISTIQLEDILLHHPALLEAAVIAVRHEEWGERPVAVVTKKAGTSVSEDQLKEHFQEYVREGKIAKFW